MRDPLLWLHGDPTEGRRIRVPEPGAARDAPPPAPPDPQPPPRSPRPLRPALAGGLVSATLVAGGAFGLGLVDGDAPRAAALAPSSAAVSPRQQGDVAAIYRAASPAVVSIRTGSGSGTGFVVDTDGTIVTNAHVVGDSDSVQVQFSDDRTATGDVRGVDRSSDLAIVQVTRRVRPHRARARRLRHGPHGPARGRDRLAVRPSADRDGGDRVRHRPPHPGARRLPDRLRDPDRRADQPRQLRRPAARRARAA